MPDRRVTETMGRRARPGILADRDGAVAIEYGLLAAMIVIALVGMSTLTGVADKQSTTYSTLSDNMAN